MSPSLMSMITDPASPHYRIPETAIRQSSANAHRHAGHRGAGVESGLRRLSRGKSTRIRTLSSVASVSPAADTAN
jgi:hypothetical protein